MQWSSLISIHFHENWQSQTEKVVSMTLFHPEVTADRVVSSWGLHDRNDTAPLRSFQWLLAIFDVPWNGEAALWPRPSFPHGLLDDMTLGMLCGELRLSFPACEMGRQWIEVSCLLAVDQSLEEPGCMCWGSAFFRSSHLIGFYGIWYLWY